MSMPILRCINVTRGYGNGRKVYIPFLFTGCSYADDNYLFVLGWKNLWRIYAGISFLYIVIYNIYMYA